MARFSRWAARNQKIAFNDFPSGWDYQKRYGLYQEVVRMENLDSAAINYLEFGVASGESFKWFLRHNTHPESRFHGFDTFTGLPEDFGVYKKGSFSSSNEVPVIADTRGAFHQGLFQQTLPGFLRELNNSRRTVIMMDADIFSATLYALATLAPFLKKGDIIFFDEFSVPTHEFRAYESFIQAYYLNLDLIAAANNYYFVAFRVS
jgi:O-methyltransferase